MANCNDFPRCRKECLIMSQHDVEHVIGRAATDSAFRLALVSSRPRPAIECSRTTAPIIGAVILLSLGMFQKLLYHLAIFGVRKPWSRTRRKHGLRTPNCHVSMAGIEPCLSSLVGRPNRSAGPAAGPRARRK